MKRIAMIDGDIVAYQQAGLTEVPVHWGDDIWTLHADAREAKQKVDAFLEDMKVEVEADSYLVAVSGQDNFRKAIYPLYKEHRTGRRPMVLGEVKEHLIFKHKAKWAPVLEADDIMGVWATTPERGVEKVLISIDKDFRTIPGLHYNWNEPIEKIVEVTEAQADYNFLTQTLTGDTTDGYPGCPGVGPKKAEAILGDIKAFTSIKDAWPSVVKAYVKAGLNEKEAIVQAQMARILRHEEYNFHTHKIYLWRPE